MTIDIENDRSWPPQALRINYHHFLLSALKHDSQLFHELFDFPDFSLLFDPRTASRTDGDETFVDTLSRLVQSSVTDEDACFQDTIYGVIIECVAAYILSAASSILLARTIQCTIAFLEVFLPRGRDISSEESQRHPGIPFCGSSRSYAMIAHAPLPSCWKTTSLPLSPAYGHPLATPGAPYASS